MPPNNIKIVLDSCVIIYSIDENTRESTKVILDKFSINGNRLTCSALSGFEVLKNRQEHQNESEYVAILNNLYRIPIDTAVLNSASTLYFLYKQTTKIQKPTETFKLDPKDKLTGDLIVGATTISYENHWLLTSNKKDFPEKYWISKFEDEIITMDGASIKIYLLEPNIINIEKDLGDNLKDPDNQPSRSQVYEYRG